MAPRQEFPEVRQNLTRSDLTTAAITLIEREGLSALTMRRLASELDCAPMSLYTHVRNREDLIDAIVDHLIERLELHQLNGDSWQRLVRQTLDRYRDLAVQLPNSFELLALAPYGSSPVAPHMSSLLSTLERAGLSRENARQILGIVDAFASGFLVVWARSRVQTPAGEHAADELGISGLGDLEMFDRGLEALIVGLDATLVRGVLP